MSESWFAWLIEQGQPEGYVPPIYYTGNSRPDPEARWSPDPWEAQQYPDIETARLIIEDNRVTSGRPVQHGFTCEHEHARCDFCNRPVTAATPSPAIPEADPDAQFLAIDRALLATFQWSDRDHPGKYGLAAHAFLRLLQEDGWDVRHRAAIPEAGLDRAELGGVLRFLDNEGRGWKPDALWAFDRVRAYVEGRLSLTERLRAEPAEKDVT